MKRDKKKGSLFLGVWAIPFAGILLSIGCDGNRPVAPGSFKTPTATSTITPTPSGGGMRKIIFSSERNGTIADYTMSADGSNVIQLSGFSVPLIPPVFSFDGTKVTGRGAYPNVGIYICDADGSNPLALTTDNQDSSPSFSPDGSRVTFGRRYIFDSQVYVVNVDGSNLVRLTGGTPTPGPSSPTAGGGEPAWSPDGTKIAYSFYDSYGDEDGLYVMNADGSSPVNLTIGSTGFFFSPAWSPDGSKIAFVRLPFGGYFDICVMNADGSGQILLTDDPAEDSAPCFSPDGTRILFCSDRVGNYELWSMKTDGTDVVNLTKNPSREFIGGLSWR